MDVIKELAMILGGTTVAVAALAWLTKSLMSHLLSKDIEEHKAKLDAQNEVQLEKLRAELTRRTLEHEILFRRVDDKVAEHLAEVYRRLFLFYESVSSLVKIVEWSGEPSKDEKLQLVADANREFWDYFLPNRIYVPPRLFERIRGVANKLADISSDFSRGLRRERQGIVNEEEDHWPKALKAVSEEASPLFTEMVRDVQKRLGVEDIDADVVSD